MHSETSLGACPVPDVKATIGYQLCLELGKLNPRDIPVVVPATILDCAPFWRDAGPSCISKVCFEELLA